MHLDHLDIFGSFGIIWKRNMTRNSEHLPQALDIVSNIAMVCDITINATSMINQMKPPMFVVPSANQNCVMNEHLQPHRIFPVTIPSGAQISMISR
jgi:hypothetical protein